MFFIWTRIFVRVNNKPFGANRNYSRRRFKQKRKKGKTKRETDILSTVFALSKQAAEVTRTVSDVQDTRLRNNPGYWDTLSDIGTPYLLTILVLQMEMVYSTPRDVSQIVLYVWQTV